ncbi:MAG: Ca-activated chloride channel family protein [Phenylobacterium sp.]|jgi:Ca-activated chloride channel family protein
MRQKHKAKTMTKTIKQLTLLTLAVTVTTLLAGCNSNPENKQTAKGKDDTAVVNKQPTRTIDVALVSAKPAKAPKPITPIGAQTQAQADAAAVRAKMYQKHQTPPFRPVQQETLDTSSMKIAKPRSSLKGKHAQIAPHATMAETSMMYMPPPEDFIGQNDQQNRENYADTRDSLNPVYQTQQNPVSTFSIDVDTASYTNVRRLLNQGHWPEKGAVRVEEMINYFNYNYDQPKSAEQPFAVHHEVAPSPWNSGTHLMRIALKGYQVSKDNLPPMNLVFLLDVSGSMSNANKLPLLKQVFSLLTKQLRAQDHVSIVVYAGASGLVLKPTAGDKQSEILAALDVLNAGGGTNGAAGIHLAYQTAKSHFNKDGINRVILATDGDFNVGTTNVGKLKTLVEKQKDSGIFLSIMGFGQGNYNDHLMEELSNKGNGTAYYIDSFKEARKVFADGLTGTLQTIAKDVKIQVEFNPAQVSEYRLIGYDNRQLKREDFNNDKVDAGDIGAGHTVTAFYELVLTGSNYHFNDPLRYGNKTQASQNKATDNTVNKASGELAFVKLRYKQPNSDKSQLMTLPIMANSKLASFDQASGEFQFATAVAGFAEKLRHSQYVNWPLSEIKQVALANAGKDTWGYRHEFVQLTSNAEVIKP